MERVRHMQLDCTFPPALSELDLIAAIDDEAEPRVLHHLCRCPHCAARAKALATMQDQLRAKLYRLFCPLSDDLIDYQQGLLSSERHASIARHLAICPHCAHELLLLTHTTRFHTLVRP